MIDYKALAGRVAQRVIYADNNADPSNKGWAADLRTVVSLLNGMAEAQPVAWSDGLGSFIAADEKVGDDPDILAYRVSLYTRPVPAVPAGWKLVPVEPTREMIFAAQQYHEGEAYLPFSLYKAMLAAAPAVPQAEPIADSDADYWLRNRQPILDAIERAGFMLMSNASGFWLHPRGKTDAQAGPIDPHMIVAEDRFPDAQVEPKREDQPLRDLLAVIHCDGGHHTEAVGLDQSIKDAQAAVYVLKRELAMAKRDPVLIDLLKQAEKCLAAGVRVDQTAPDEPPISEWDYEADRLSAEIFAWMKVHGIGGSDD